MKVKDALFILEIDLPDGPLNNIFEGMKFITELYNGKYINMGAGHGQIWYGDFEETVEKMTEEQVIFMAECGWFEDDGSWSTFV